MITVKYLLRAMQFSGYISVRRRMPPCSDVEHLGSGWSSFVVKKFGTRTVLETDVYGTTLIIYVN